MSDKVNSITTVTAGPVTVTTLDTDVDPDPADVHVVDGVALSTRLELPWPMQETESATFQLWAAAADQLAGVSKGRSVSITYGTPRVADTTRASFEGRITDAVLRPRTDGVVLEVTAMDHRTVDLAEEVGDEPWPEEPITDRVARIFDLLGVTFDHTTRLPLPGGGLVDLGTFAPGSAPLVKARDVDRQPALALLTPLLDAWAVDWTTELEALGHTVPDGAGLGRFVLRPVVDASGDVSVWETVPRLAALTPDGAYTLPGKFGPTPDPGGYGVTFPTADPDRAPALVPAGVVDLAAAYTQRPGQRPNSVSVGWWNAAGEERTASASTGQRPVTRRRIDTELVTQADAERAAQLYLPDPSSSDWYADDFTWRWYADPDAHDQAIPAIGDLLTIAPIPDRHSPTGRPEYAGVLTGRTVQLVNARPVVDLTISPELRPLLGTPASGLAWNDLPAGTPGTAAYATEVMADSPLAYYRMGEAAGATVMADASGNARHGGYFSGVGLGVAALLINDANAAISMAANAANVAQVSDAAWMDVATLTVEILVKFTGATDATNGDAVVSRYTSNGSTWRIYRNTSGGFTASLNDAFNGVRTVATAAGFVTTGQTYHVALTCSMTTLTLYVDGVAVGTDGAVNTGVRTSSASPIQVGKMNQNDATTGAATFDELAIYGYELAAARIAAHAASAAAGATPPSGDAVTWNDLNTRDTWDDYRLLRG